MGYIILSYRLHTTIKFTSVGLCSEIHSCGKFYNFGEELPIGTCRLITHQQYSGKK